MSQFVRTMLDKGLTADESMGLLQDLIADERVQLTNTYRLRAAE
ncbi:hypothetical protein [Crystallibacter degradans]|nr:hypothetical protein [Arthrobacter sp. SF27]